MPWASGLLRVDDRHIGGQRGHGDQLLPGERARDRRHLSAAHQVGSDIAAHQRAGHSGRAGRVAIGHARVAVLLDLDRPRPSVLDGVAEAVKRAHTRVSTVGEDETAGRSHPDHLVEDKIGRHPDQLELLLALAQQLVSGRERDQVGEPLQCDAVAVADELVDRLGQRDDLSHNVRYAYKRSQCAQYTEHRYSTGWPFAVSVTSIFPRVALEYGQTRCAAATRSPACLASGTCGRVTSSWTAR